MLQDSSGRTASGLLPRHPARQITGLVLAVAALPQVQRGLGEGHHLERAGLLARPLGATQVPGVGYRQDVRRPPPGQPVRVHGRGQH